MPFLRVHCSGGAGRHRSVAIGSADRQFERFNVHFLECYYRAENGKVHRFGGTGHKQLGIDIAVHLPDGRCRFDASGTRSSGQISMDRTGVRSTPTRLIQRILLLSACRNASARQAAEQHAGWDIWDKEDITLKVRQWFSVNDQRRLVDIFRDNVLFDSVSPESGPWPVPEVFFAPVQPATFAL